mmetsp:Transcript_108775/g.198075  ORF Transcript_108775/g.198075 Transcript_108775/m.198075 type:complete len:132 (+) Transcript_108775:75-470(+)
MSARYTVTILGAMDLPNLDGPFDKSDPYCRVTMGGTELFKTPTKNNTLNPTWGTTQVITWDGINDLIFTIMDSDFFTKDDWMGQYILPKDQIPKGAKGSFPVQVHQRFAKRGMEPQITLKVEEFAECCCIQ